MSIPTLSTFKQFTKKYPAFCESGIRYQRFNEPTNGLKEFGVFVNDGSRVLINDERYFLAIELKNTGEFDAVIKLIRQAKEQGNYLSPEDAVLQVRGVAVAHTGQPQQGNKREGRHATR
jgi:hypothetical protein